MAWVEATHTCRWEVVHTSDEVDEVGKGPFARNQGTYRQASAADTEVEPVFAFEDPRRDIQAVEAKSRSYQDVERVAVDELKRARSA